jgi:hypothetical protein
MRRQAPLCELLAKYCAAERPLIEPQLSTSPQAALDRLPRVPVSPMLAIGRPQNLRYGFAPRRTLYWRAKNVADGIIPDVTVHDFKNDETCAETAWR